MAKKKTKEIKFPEGFLPKEEPQEKKEFKPVEDSSIVLEPKTNFVTVVYLENRLKDLNAYFSAFYGKKGHNPFYKLQELRILGARLNSGEKSEELVNLIENFKKEPPTI